VTLHYRLGLIVGVILLGYPAIAAANFAWAPLIYAYSYTVWWVILPGLLIEGLVYFFAWRRSILGTAVLTVVVNAASAAAGMLYVLVSLGFLASEVRSLMAGFIWASPLLIFAATVTAEYLTGTRLFNLPRSWKTVAIFAAANVPSVGLAIFGTLWLAAKALTGA